MLIDPSFAATAALVAAELRWFDAQEAKLAAATWIWAQVEAGRSLADVRAEIAATEASVRLAEIATGHRGP